MGVIPDITAETGLQFFGRISASISHEIKNVLAIVNENAGLLEDFSIMAEGGMPLDPARLKKMASTVMNQVSRGDEIIKNMNRLAHSIDDTIATVELKEIIELFMALTVRLTAMRKIFRWNRTIGKSGEDQDSSIFPDESSLVVPGVLHVRKRR